jgi:MarR family transcriptional regulator for hemolysin
VPRSAPAPHPARRPAAEPEPLARTLSFAHKALHERAEEELAAHGSDLTTWIVLHQLAAPERAVSQRELADLLGIAGPTLVRHLDRLEAEGLVRRTRDDRDRRVSRLSLTPRARRLLQRLRPVMAELDRQMRAQLSAAELRTLERALGKLQAWGARAADGATLPRTLPSDRRDRP